MRCYGAHMQGCPVWNEWGVAVPAFSAAESRERALRCRAALPRPYSASGQLKQQGTQAGLPRQSGQRAAVHARSCLACACPDHSRPAKTIPYTGYGDYSFKSGRDSYSIQLIDANTKSKKKKGGREAEGYAPNEVKRENSIQKP